LTLRLALGISLRPDFHISNMHSNRSHSQSTFARRVALFLFFSGLCTAAAAFGQTGFTGIFGGGPFYINAANNIAEIQNSDFTEAIIWNIEVKTNGDLNFNGEFPIVSNGVYIGDQTHPDFPGNMALLKQGTIQRITFSIGSSNFGDWQDIKALVNSEGTGDGQHPLQELRRAQSGGPSARRAGF
jgi:hypothetical protein